MPYVWDGRSWLSVDTVDAQLTEKRSAMSLSDRNTPRRLIQVDRVDDFHKIQLLLFDRLWLTVDG